MALPIAPGSSRQGRASQSHGSRPITISTLLVHSQHSGLDTRLGTMQTPLRRLGIIAAVADTAQPGFLLSPICRAARTGLLRVPTAGGKQAPLPPWTEVGGDRALCRTCPGGFAAHPICAVTFYRCLFLTLRVLLRSLLPAHALGSCYVVPSQDGKCQPSPNPVFRQKRQ